MTNQLNQFRAVLTFFQVRFRSSFPREFTSKILSEFAQNLLATICDTARESAAYGQKYADRTLLQIGFEAGGTGGGLCSEAARPTPALPGISGRDLRGLGVKRATN